MQKGLDAVIHFLTMMILLIILYDTAYTRQKVVSIEEYLLERIKTDHKMVEMFRMEAEVRQKREELRVVQEANQRLGGQLNRTPLKP